MHRRKKGANKKMSKKTQIWDVRHIKQIVVYDFKTTNIKMFKELNETMSKELKG